MMNDDQHFGDRPESDEVDAEQIAESAERDKWVRLARNAYQASTDYMTSSVRNQWETNLNNFNSTHADVSTSKTSRKKMFRPKTRSSLRSYEAALASAMFSNNDLVGVTGVDDNSKLQEKSAKLNKALLQHRLSKTIPWFLTVLGAFQDTNVYGICISKQTWSFKTEEITEFQLATNPDGSSVLDEEGYELGQDVVVGQKVVQDEPAIDLIAPENFRFDPNADWRNVVKTSPYLIEEIPMYANDVLELMGQEDTKTNAPKWHEYSLSEIIAAGTGNLDGNATRLAREKDRVDPQDIGVANEHKTVWVHFNIYRENGKDVAFYTLGTTLLLSDPVPLTDYHKVGREVYQVGFATVEAHKTYPTSAAELGENLQAEINTVADSRLQNVKLVLNKRYFIKRQGNVDLGALMRNVAGGGIMVDDPNNDVKVIDTPDVTSSSYAEQDRLNMDMDELMGTFSPSTVQSNRSLNETVGGMNLMSSGANVIQEYIMRTFIETWVEPVLRTLTKLEQHYETDETILALAADKAGVKEELAAAYQNPNVLDEMIQQDLTVTVNVGMGNTNPQQKLQKLMMAVNSTAAMPNAQERTDWDEVIKEVYSHAGYGDGARFLKPLKEKQEGQPEMPPPEVQAMQAEAEAQKQIVQAAQQHEMQMLQMKIQADTAALDRKLQAEGQTQINEINSRREIELVKIADAKGIKLEELRSTMQIESSKDKTKRDIEALKANTMNREMNLKRTVGSGI